MKNSNFFYAVYASLIGSMLSDAILLYVGPPRIIAVMDSGNPPTPTVHFVNPIFWIVLFVILTMLSTFFSIYYRKHLSLNEKKGKASLYAYFGISFVSIITSISTYVYVDILRLSDKGTGFLVSNYSGNGLIEIVYPSLPVMILYYAVLVLLIVAGIIFYFVLRHSQK